MKCRKARGREERGRGEERGGRKRKRLRTGLSTWQERKRATENRANENRNQSERHKRHPIFFSWIAKRFPRDGSEITNKAPIRRARRREQELIFGRKSVVPSGEHREAPFYGGTLSGFMLRKLFKQTRHEAREGPCLRHLAGRGGGRTAERSPPQDTPRTVRKAVLIKEPMQ